ncbi:MAG: hypothetical protein Q9N62_10930 [Ghiorsea sp.]|nr:hypothetical protein [Ghiorsea sp.]
MYIFTEAQAQQNDYKPFEDFMVIIKALSWLCLVLMPWTMLAMLGDIMGVVVLSPFAFKLVVFMLFGAAVQLVLYSRK